MPIKVNGVDEWTVADVARHFGVTTKTVHSWINSARVEPPPRTWHGFRRIAYFPQEWVRKTERLLRQAGETR